MVPALRLGAARVMHMGFARSQGTGGLDVWCVLDVYKLSVFRGYGVVKYEDVKHCAVSRAPRLRASQHEDTRAEDFASKFYPNKADDIFGQIEKQSWKELSCVSQDLQRIQLPQTFPIQFAQDCGIDHFIYALELAD